MCQKGKIGWVRHEFILIILIISCITYIITYENATRTYNAISLTDSGTVSILHDNEEIEIYESKGRPIIYYTHDACQFISVYNKDGSRQSLVMLNDVEPLYDKIDKLYDWNKIFEESEKGSIDLISNGVDITIYFEWFEFENGTEYLIIYGIDNLNQKLFDAFHISCYAAIILSFTMLANLIYWRYYNITNNYKKVNEEVRKIMS